MITIPIENVFSHNSQIFSSSEELIHRAIILEDVGGNQPTPLPYKGNQWFMSP